MAHQVRLIVVFGDIVVPAVEHQGVQVFLTHGEVVAHSHAPLRTLDALTHQHVDGVLANHRQDVAQGVLHREAGAFIGTHVHAVVGILIGKVLAERFAEGCK